MIRLIVLVKKNLLRFIRNPKTLGLLILIPVVYYAMIGAIFGGINFEDTTTTYYVGWIDHDNTTANYKYHPNFKLDFINNFITTNVSGINLVNYTTQEVAKAASLNGTISAYVYFPQGFEKDLEQRSYLRLAFWDKDNSNSTLGYSKAGYLASLESTLTSEIKFTNVSGKGNKIYNNFDDYQYDAMLVINDNFLKGLDNKWNVNMSYLYRKNNTSGQNAYVMGKVISATYNYFYSINYLLRSNFSFTTDREIADSTPFDPIQYEIYFLQTVSPAEKAAIKNIITQVIDGIINGDPIQIQLEAEEKSTVGRKVNNITYSAPGYVLYGPMTILTFALVVLTDEKKQGIYKRLSSTEVKNWEIISSSIISNITLIFMQFAIGAFILYLFGWNPIVYSLFDAVVGIILTMLLFSFLILALAFALAPVFKDPDTAGGGVWIILIPLSMLSGIFVPVELFGEQMQAIASWLPPRFAVVALQNLLLNGLPLNNPETLINLGLLLLYSAVIFIIGLKLFNKFKS